jgi:DegV family protein with EDD domain
MAPRVCILTDSTAQFPIIGFPGQELVNIIPMHLQLNGQFFPDAREIKISNLPDSARNGSEPKAISPSPEEFGQYFTTLGHKYNEIITILTSSHLTPTFSYAQQAAEVVRGSATIHLIDSQTAAVGLGLLVQAAASAAETGSTATQINRLIRGLVPRIYTVFCVQSLTYLYRSGYIDLAQAIVGEMLGVMPFFILEYGRLVPIQKVRSPRHLVDILHEFVSEFSNLKHIALIHGFPAYEQEARNLRERIEDNFPKVNFSEHTMSTALAAILGPRSLGLVAMEQRLDS